MYPAYSMANHSCCASAMAVVGGGSATGYELQLRAQVPIKKVQSSGRGLSVLRPTLVHSAKNLKLQT